MRETYLQIVSDATFQLVSADTVVLVIPRQGRVVAQLELRLGAHVATVAAIPHDARHATARSDARAAVAPSTVGWPISLPLSPFPGAGLGENRR